MKIRYTSSEPRTFGAVVVEPATDETPAVLRSVDAVEGTVIEAALNPDESRWEKAPAKTPLNEPEPLLELPVEPPVEPVAESEATAEPAPPAEPDEPSPAAGADA